MLKYGPKIFLRKKKKKKTKNVRMGGVLKLLKG
jgi:hypothetical protein